MEAGFSCRLRRLKPGELDHEIIWLGVSAMSAAVALTWLWLRLPLSSCVVWRTTGIPCPTCGATRCVIHLIHARLTQAFLVNPLIFMSLVFIALYDAYALAVVALRLPRLRDVRLSPRAANMVRAGAVVILLANWAYLFVTLK